jgi:hypothetical protein
MFILTFLRQTWEWIKTVLLPDRYFSWLTVIYLSLFSWLMSLLGRSLGASTITVGIMTTLSWIFLAVGIGWALEANQVKFFGLSLAPWVAGAIVCIFLFGSWGDNWLQPALITWPLISFAVVAVPNLLSWELQYKKPTAPVRQQLVLLFFLSLLLSSWFQFYFRIQNWLQAYPSLVADTVEESNFVYRIPGQTLPLSAGVTHLTEAEMIIKAELDGKPWSWVERWLLNVEGQEQAIQQKIQQNQRSSPEDDLWRFEIQPFSNGPGYTLELRAIWTGPTAEKSGYYLEKSCQVMPVGQASAYGSPTPGSVVPTQWARVTCDLEVPRVTGRP